MELKQWLGGSGIAQILIAKMKLNEHPILVRLTKRKFPEKRIVSSLRKCAKKLSPKSSGDLSNLKDLIYALCVYGYTEEARATAQVISGEEFRGDFQLWTPIEAILLLHMWLEQTAGAKDKAKDIYRKLSEPMSSHEEALRRRLSFEWLSGSDIAQYEISGKTKIANDLRFAELGDLLFIWAHGNHYLDLNDKKPDVAEAERQFRDSLGILKNAG